MIVQPFDGSFMFFTSMFYHPNDHIRGLARRIRYQLSEVIVVCVLQLIFNDDFTICTRFGRKDINIKISYGRFRLINGNIKPCRIGKESDIIIL